LKTSAGIFLALVFFVLSSCTSQNPRDRFLLAERLWQEKNYSAAVTEYEKVVQKDPSSDLGIEAAFRAATTQTLFLNEHLGALKKLNRIVEVSRDHRLAHPAYKLIGEILFATLFGSIPPTRSSSTRSSKSGIAWKNWIRLTRRMKSSRRFLRNIRTARSSN
jgi:tetratricopeptide (TPR) repeat protein